MSHLKRIGLILIAVASGACLESANRETPSPSSETQVSSPSQGERIVPEGYQGIDWLTPRSTIATTVAELRAADDGRNTLYRRHEVRGHAATEIYFFDDENRLIEVELRLKPKLDAATAGELARHYDRLFGPHQVTRADASRYQFVWSGADTEIYFTYDITDAVPEAPIVNFTWRDPSATQTEAEPVASDEFARAALRLMVDGWTLIDVAGGKTRFVMILGLRGSRQKLTLDLDPEHGHVKQFDAGAPYDVGEIGKTKSAAETAIKVRLTTVGGPIAVLQRDGLTYLIFEDGSFVSLEPGSADLLKEAGGSLPDWLDALPLPTLEPIEAPTPQFLESPSPTPSPAPA